MERSRPKSLYTIPTTTWGTTQPSVTPKGKFSMDTLLTAQRIKGLVLNEGGTNQRHEQKTLSKTY